MLYNKTKENNLSENQEVGLSESLEILPQENETSRLPQEARLHITSNFPSLLTHHEQVEQEEDRKTV
jgi:hypothetical protein